MIPEILSAYDIHPDQVEFQLIGNGLINKTWLIKTSAEDYILQKINTHIFKNPEDIASNISLIGNFLQKHFPSYLFMSPIKTKNNESMKYMKGIGYYRLFPFIKKSHSVNTVQNTRQAYEAAKKFGELTKLLSALPVEKLRITIPDFHNLPLRYKQLKEAIENGNQQRKRKATELIDFIIENEIIADIYKDIMKNPAFKLRVMHHDTKISNVLFNDNSLICVIDLDTLMPGYFISDAGDMMRTYLSPVNEEEKDFSLIEIREEYFKAIWEGYMSEMSDELTIEEKMNFIYSGKFMIYMQAIRFLIDYLHDDIYYGVTYENQNLIRAGNQVTLLKALQQKEDQLQSIILEY